MVLKGPERDVEADEGGAHPVQEGDTKNAVIEELVLLPDHVELRELQALLGTHVLLGEHPRGDAGIGGGRESHTGCRD